MMRFEYLKDYCCLYVIANAKLQFFRIDNDLYQIPGGELEKEQMDTWHYMVWDCTIGELVWLPQDIKVVPVNIIVSDNGPIYDDED